MWRFARPSSAELEAFLAEQRGERFTYPEVGATRGARTTQVGPLPADELPAGYAHDHNRQHLGSGVATFAAARDALRAWEMFPAPFAQVLRTPPIVEGEVVGVLVHALGLWWLNSARIVYVIDVPRRFGFAYGTLPGHAECGEERFLVEHLPDDSVWYDLTAFSRPRYWGARATRPIVRALQRRFASASKVAMVRAIAQAR